MRALAARPVHLGLLFAALSACSGPHREARTPTPPPPPPPLPVEPDAGPPAPVEPLVFEDTAAPDGPACLRSSDCAAGAACRGPAGCGGAWACGEPRSCEPATIAYCDCDGATFYAPSGCAGRAYLHVGPCELASAEPVELGIPDGDEPLTDEDRTCTSSADCRSWETCFGLPGCASGFRCERVRRCRRDRIEYCGCDGETFTASSNCPGRPYLRAGACDEDTAVASLGPDGGDESDDPALALAASAAGTTDAGATTGAGEASVSVAAETPSTEPEALPPGACRSSADCRRPRICVGPQGCGFTWTCERPPPERCNPDTQVFCDCEGETFRASMNCPGHTYAHRGSCEIDRLLDLAGGALR